MLIGFIFPVFIFFRVVLNILLLKYILFFILFVYTFRRRTLSTCRCRTESGRCSIRESMAPPILPKGEGSLQACRSASRVSRKVYVRIVLFMISRYSPVKIRLFCDMHKFIQEKPFLCTNKKASGVSHTPEAFMLHQRRRKWLLQLLILVLRCAAELLLDADELVVLGHTVGTRERTRLDLAAVGSHGDVGDGGVLRLT